MLRADVDGITLEYEVSGNGEPVVFIHGAFIADSFRPLIGQASLASQYQLITYRRRGYAGSSPVAGPISAERQAADCRALLDFLGLARSHVVGHSFGGCVALQVALDAPDLVQSLALLEPGLMLGVSGPSYRESLVRSTQRYRLEGAAVVMEGFFQARWPSYSRAKLEHAVPGGFEQALADTPAMFEQDIGLLDWTFGEAEARRIAARTLVVLGGESPRLHPRFQETYEQLLDWLPNAEGFVLPGATHFLHIEQPTAAGGLAAALADFWARHPFDAGSRSEANFQ